MLEREQTIVRFVLEGGPRGRRSPPLNLRRGGSKGETQSPLELAQRGVQGGDAVPLEPVSEASLGLDDFDAVGAGRLDHKEVLPGLVNHLCSRSSSEEHDGSADRIALGVKERGFQHALA